jgi:UDP:flavonoid glycosyltransferase YjiC (YdhE family)
MRVAVVAGPEAGHAFPAIALCLRFAAAGDDPVLLTGVQWLDTARRAGVDAVELLGLDPEESDDDADEGIVSPEADRPHGALKARQPAVNGRDMPRRRLHRREGDRWIQAHR